MAVSGAKPAGAADETSAAQAVQRMFDSIAPRYDLLNHLLSAISTGCGGTGRRGAFVPSWPGPTRPFWISAAAPAT